MTNDLIAIVELVGAMVVDIVHWRLERERERERERGREREGERERG